MLLLKMYVWKSKQGYSEFFSCCRGPCRRSSFNIALSDGHRLKKQHNFFFMEQDEAERLCP